MSIDYKGTCVHYGVFGKQNNKTLFFLHGWGCDGNIFMQTISDLQKFYQCVVLTFPPFGKSGASKEVWQLEDYSKIVFEVKNQLDIKNFGIICHSFGTRVAINYSNCYNNVNVLVITGGAGIRPRRGIKYYFKVWFYKIFKKLLNTKKYGSSDYKKLDGKMKKTFINIVNSHQNSNAKNIKIPTLLIYGDKDKQTPIYMAKKYNKLIKKSVLKIYKGADHFAFITKRELFFSDTLEFLKKHY
jgi:pimeloyl-ACP methyl ester carboxylesterase